MICVLYSIYLSLIQLMCFMKTNYAIKSKRARVSEHSFHSNNKWAFRMDHWKAKCWFDRIDFFSVRIFTKNKTKLNVNVNSDSTKHSYFDWNKLQIYILCQKSRINTKISVICVHCTIYTILPIQINEVLQLIQEQH